MISNLNPFYIYTADEILYLKKLNQQPKKIAINIKFYCANIDSKNRFHICAIDNKGKMIHLTYINNKWQKRTIGKFFESTRHIKEIRLFIINNYFNVFVVQQNQISNNLYRVNHFNFSPSNYRVYKHQFNSIQKNDESIYKLVIDDLSNIIFSYYENHLDGLDSSKVVMLFNSVSRNWIPFNHANTLNEDFFTPTSSSSNLEHDVFDFLYSIKYHLK